MQTEWDASAQGAECLSAAEAFVLLRFCLVAKFLPFFVVPLQRRGFGRQIECLCALLCNFEQLLPRKSKNIPYAAIENRRGDYSVHVDMLAVAMHHKHPRLRSAPAHEI